MLKHDTLVKAARGQHQSLRTDARNEARAPMARGEAGVVHWLRVPAAADCWRLGIEWRIAREAVDDIVVHRLL